MTGRSNSHKILFSFAKCLGLKTATKSSLGQYYSSYRMEYRVNVRSRSAEMMLGVPTDSNKVFPRTPKVLSAVTEVLTHGKHLNTVTDFPERVLVLSPVKFPISI